MDSALETASERGEGQHTRFVSLEPMFGSGLQRLVVVKGGLIECGSTIASSKSGGGGSGSGSGSSKFAVPPKLQACIFMGAS